MKSGIKNVLIIFLIVTSLLLSVYSIFLISNQRNIKLQNEKRLLFLDWVPDQNFAFLMGSDLKGAFLQRVGSGTGSLAWSKDGKYIAIGCEDPSKICILDPKFFYDAYAYPPKPPAEPPLVNKIDLPSDCTVFELDKGISSISWSKDGSKLLVVCQNQKRSNVCVFDLLYKENFCWGENQEVISRADWSPTNDLIVLDVNNVIQIVDAHGSVIRQLMNGFSPSWSPDGNEIAFVHFDEERGYEGIAIMRKDGSALRWVYRPPKRGSSYDADYYKLALTNYSDCSLGASKIAWSSDEKYLIVDSSYMDLCVFAIFKIEIATGKISILTTNAVYSPQEPAIQP